MPHDSADLWVFFIATALVAAILIVTVAASVILSERKLNAASREFAARVLSVSEEERARVARELHDDVSQQIAIMSQRMEHLQDGLRREAADSTALTEAAEVASELRELADTVRTIAHRMHPSLLDHVGLGAALTGLAGELEGPGLGISVTAGANLETIPPSVAIGVYRVAQEALRNARKHADAARITVRVGRLDGELLLEVQDDGRGLPAAAAIPTPVHGLGLVSMQERARLMNGRLVVEPAPGGGTRVMLWVTLPASEQKP